MENMSEIIKENLSGEYFQRDKVEKLAIAYLEAFRGFPWSEDSLTINEVNKRLESQLNKTGLRIFTFENAAEEIVAASWFDTPTLSDIENERGLELRNFAERTMSAWKIDRLIWEREVLVVPSYQNLGLGTRIRTRVIEYIDRTFYSSLILTRMRDDNFPIIKIAEKLGFKRTDITKPSSQILGVSHEYWFRTGGIK